MNQEHRELQIARRIAGSTRNRNLALDPKAAEILSRPNILSGITVPESGSAEIEGSEGKLIIFDVDSSPSMKSHRDAVMRGLNGLLDRMASSPTAVNTLIHTMDIYGKVISPLDVLSKAKKLSYGNFDPNRGDATPLRDSVVKASGQLVHESQRQFSKFKLINGIVFILTDGGENDSKNSAADTKLVVEETRKTNNALYIGAGLGRREKYVREFGNMGIPEEFVISGTDVDAMFKLVGDVTAAVSDPASFRALAIRGLSSRRVM